MGIFFVGQEGLFCMQMITRDSIAKGFFPSLELEV